MMRRLPRCELVASVEIEQSFLLLNPLLPKFDRLRTHIVAGLLGERSILVFRDH